MPRGNKIAMRNIKTARLLICVFTLSSLFAWCMPATVHAETAGQTTEQQQQQTQALHDKANQEVLNLYSTYKVTDSLGNKSIPAIIARVISWALPLTGALFMIMFLYGGFTWMTAGGDLDRVKKANKTLTNAVIGMALVFFAYILVANVITKFGASLG